MPIPTSTQRSGIDMLASAPAGISLTEDNSKFPWGNPPKESDPDKVMTTMLDRLDKPKAKTNMLKLLMAGMSVESLVEGMVYKGFESGDFSLDVGMLMKGPLSLYMADMAEQEGVPYRLLEDEQALERGVISDESMLRIMKKNNPNMYTYLNEQVNQIVRAGGLENIEKQVKENAPQSFLLSGEENI